MVNKFIGLSGLPRSGATLLSAILDQNPEIHAEGNSALCQLMWSLQEACYGVARRELNAAYRGHTILRMVTAVFHAYYKEVSAPVIIDKCRSWTIPENMAMLQKYFVGSPKVIVMERPLVDVLKSFKAIDRANGSENKRPWRLLPNSLPIVRSLDGVIWAKQNNQNGNFLFISYDELVTETERVLTSIYEFCEIAPFKHDLNNIINNHPENDVGVYNNPGLHDVRPTISKRRTDETLPDDLVAKCAELEASNVLGHIKGWAEIPSMSANESN